MPSDLGIPRWLLVGGGLGALLTVVIAAVFLLGERLFPGDRSPEDRDGRQRVEQTRREEIEYYLSAIDEPYETDAEVAGHDVAVLLPERSVAVTFDPRAYLGLSDDPEVEAILVEHEMPGVHLGARLPFETPTIGEETEAGHGPGAGPGGPWSDPDPDPDPGFGAAPGAGSRGVDHGSGRSAGGGSAVGGRTGGATPGGRPGTGPSGVAGPDESVRASFATLGLPPDATGREVRRAYRTRVKEVHPDHGGDERSFRRLRDAYETAMVHADADAGDSDRDDGRNRRDPHSPGAPGGSAPGADGDRPGD